MTAWRGGIFRHRVPQPAMWMESATHAADPLRRTPRRGLLALHPQVIPALSLSCRLMSHSDYFHLHLVSDATGETLITVARAAAAQYVSVAPVEHLYPMVRSKKQLDRVLAEITEQPGLVLYTLLE